MYAFHIHHVHFVISLCVLTTQPRTFHELERLKRYFWRKSSSLSWTQNTTGNSRWSKTQLQERSVVNPTCERILEKECGCLLVRYVVSNTWSSRTEVDCCLQELLRYTDCAPMWLLQTKFLASGGWKRVCQPFSCPCPAEKGSVRHVCCRSPCLLGNLSLHSLPEAWGPWEPQYAPPVLHYACIMPIPSLQLKKRDLSHAEKQGVWSRCCGLQELLRYTDCAPMWLLQTKFLASGGWKRGCQRFSCRCSQNVKHCRKEIYATCLSKESIQAIPLGYSKHPLLTRGRFLRVAAPSTSSTLCLHHSHPFAAAEGKNQSHAEKQKVWSRSCRLQDELFHDHDRLLFAWGQSEFLCLQKQLPRCAKVAMLPFWLQLVKWHSYTSDMHCHCTMLK